MTTSRTALLVAVALLSCPTRQAASHHAFSPVYDDKKIVTVTGQVTQFRFVNPHVMMYLDVTDEETGKVAAWIVEFAGQLNLAERGWTKDSIKPGERVTVTGAGSRSGSDRMFFRKLERADGSELLSDPPDRLNAVEEERRQRALQRPRAE